MLLGVLFIYLVFILIEGTLTSLPLSLLLLLNIAIITKKTWVFAVAFLAGLLLDVLTLNPLGKTSLFFLIFIFIVLIYDRKFEIQTYPFVLISSFFGSLAYLLIFGYPGVLAQAAFACAVAVLFFFILRKLSVLSQKDLASGIHIFL